MFELANALQPLIDGSEAILGFWQEVTGSWGAAIILLGVMIELASLPLAITYSKDSQKRQALEPEIKQVYERYEDDEERRGQELRKLHREHKVSLFPLSGLTLLLLQGVVFIALLALFESQAFKDDIAGSERFLFVPDLARPLSDHPLVLAAMMVLWIA